VNYLLDTCVLSEFTRRQPDARVVAWLDAMNEEQLFISAVTIGEVQRGIQRLPDSRRKTELAVWMDTGLTARFAGRIVTIDAATMYLWGSLVARLEAAGQPIGVMDSLILASAVQNNLIIVTRNTADFTPGGAQVINPWG
jgi:predicted nucleic acid-binding protein